MKNLVKTDFDQLYESLAKLNEDTAFPDTLSFETIQKELSSLDYSSEEYSLLLSRIKYITKAVCKKFQRPQNAWPYQFQLMYNAYQTEKYTLDLLNNNPDKVKAINDAIVEFIKSKDENATDIKLLHGKYKFLDQPNVHTEFSVNTVPANVDSGIYDIEAVNKGVEETITSVEAKATNRTAKPTDESFHDADIVFIYNIAVDLLRIKYKYNGKYEFLDGYVEENCGVKKNCIGVFPSKQSDIFITNFRSSTKSDDEN